jgi:hypothetical protein
MISQTGYSPPDRVFLPYNSWAKITNTNNFDAYSYGPNSTGTPLLSGSFFTQRWAGYFKNDKFLINTITGIDVTADDSFTGFELNWFPEDFFNSNSSQRFQNFTFSFNNSGVPLVGFQDNGDSNVGFAGKPYINVFQLSGDSVYYTGWVGECPALFNSVMLDNFNKTLPTPTYLRYQTGANVCFYQSNGALFYRYQSGFDWSSGILVSNSITSGYNGKTRMDVWENSFLTGYSPSKFVLLNFNKDGTKLRVVGSRKYVNRAFETFNLYQTGFQSINNNLVELKSGYNWGADYLFGAYNYNYVKSNDLYFFESFDNYSTGRISGYIESGTGIFFDSGRMLNSGITKSGYSVITGMTSGYCIWSGYI